MAGYGWKFIMDEQIDLPPPRKLVRPQDWFTITLPMNEFFELESLSSDSITISSIFLHVHVDIRHSLGAPLCCTVFT